MRYNKLAKKVKIKVITTFKTISRGSKDKDAVKEIQQALKDKGYYQSYRGHYLKVDGKFNSQTFKAVKMF
ncbi:peptidoglycan-binding protein [uncultured Methanobrevibacter sp.]|uniref:peptidoglycan-binding domain-containing protein n=1 Tax=uncultured Methanobrevibacter sp. TaxID=253161 RepID=UPI003741EBEF